MRRNLLLLPVVLLFAACEKEITVDLPDAEEKFVVEGTIAPGQPPVVILTRTQSYFAPTDLNSISSIFVRDAMVTVDDGISTFVLQQICSSAIPDSLIDEAAALTGLDPELLAQADICIYVSFDPAALGIIGRTYSLTVQAEGKTLTAVTTIPNPVPLDSLWFKLAEQNAGDDSLGFLWARLSDPDTAGNFYRWAHRRISHYPNGDVKDAGFVPATFSTFDDRFTNGLTFDFAQNRSAAPFSSALDDENAEAGYFKRNDTVVVRFTSLGRREFEFYSSFDTNVNSQGDLFSNPANVKSNITGGLGVWAGLGHYLDTVVCVP